MNGVNTAALAAFEARIVVDQDNRLLANRADEHVEEILRNHDRFIVAPRGVFPVTPFFPVTL